MEFVELIPIPKLDNVILHGPFHDPVEGRLCISSHHLILSSRKEGIQDEVVMYQSIDYLDKKPSSTTNNMPPSGGTIIIKCKDLRVIQFEINVHEDFLNVFSSIDRLSNVIDIALSYPFFYRPMYNILEDGHTMFRTEVEFTKLLASEEWRVSDVNRDYKVCGSYGKMLIVPKSIDDDTIIASARFRDGGRFPLVSYRHESGTILMRSSQPLLGANNRRCRCDERLLNSVLGLNKRGYIVDTRSINLANQCKTKGGGYEPETNYPQWRRIHKPLDKITNGSASLLDSFSKLVEACNDVNCSPDKWLSRLESSGWLGYILASLNAACVVAQCLDQDKVSVLVHGTTGLDATLLVTSLAQVVLNPDCRTVRGFQAIIEREWLQAGHPFTWRHSHSCYSTMQSGRTKNNQPTFLLFLDCVQQLHYQFSCSFEFTTYYLVLLFENSYFSQFGTFLGNCEADREHLKIWTNTTSLWSYLNRPDVLSSVLNPMYEPNVTPIWPSVAPISLVVWGELYLRWVIDQTPMKSSIARMQFLKQNDKNLRTQVVKLRKQVVDLQKEYDAIHDDNFVVV